MSTLGHQYDNSLVSNAFGFLRLPMNFQPYDSDADWVITGVPFDMATSGRAGGRLCARVPADGGGAALRASAAAEEDPSHGDDRAMSSLAVQAQHEAVLTPLGTELVGALGVEAAAVVPFAWPSRLATLPLEASIASAMGAAGQAQALASAWTTVALACVVLTAIVAAAVLACANRFEGRRGGE